MAITTHGLRGLLSSAVVLAGLLAPWQCASAAGDESPLDLRQYQGQVVVLDFWASWCVPCRRSFPWLNTMVDRYGDDGLVVIGVNLDNNRQDAETFLEEFPPRFRIHYHDAKQLARELEVMAMPSSYVIGRDGNLIVRHLGFKVRDIDDYESIIVEALQRQGAKK